VAVGDDDFDYSTNLHRSAIARLGTISFRTCFRTARFPADHVLRLASATYTRGAEPGSFVKACHHWLLVEILSAIGSHTML
jgi:hypothetical protein